MKEEKNGHKINSIFYGKAEDAFQNIRLFLTEKKFAKIAETEKRAIAGVRARLAELYGKVNSKPASPAGRQGTVINEEKSEVSNPLHPAAHEQRGASLQKREAKENLVFIPLSEIAKNSTYSKNYINFSARQGKLQAKKIGGVWHTTEVWLAEFTEKSKAKKNKFKEKLSHDHGGNKKFVLPKEPAKILKKTKEASERKQNRMAGMFVEKVAPLWGITLRVEKFFAKNLNDAKTWFRELREMGDTETIARLRKAKLADFWKLDYAKPAAAIIALILLMAVGNITKADLANLGDQGIKKMYFAYNAGIETAAKTASHISESAGKKIVEVKIGKEKFVKIAQDILQGEKIKEFEKNTGLSLKGDQGNKANLVQQNQGGAVLGDESGMEHGTWSMEQNQNGKVLAASTATGAAPANIGDIEVSAYLMDGENKEIPNGEYDVRFGIYTTDRTEADPYPSDTDKGTRVWEETQKVVVENGLLKTYLGATTPIPASFNFAASNYYIGIRMGEDAEMVPRKRIGAVPLARTAMNIAGQSIGNGAGNIPVSNGTLNTNLNADLLDGLHSTAFQVAGSYQPMGSYDNYIAWKLQSTATDAGQKITTNKGAIFTGANGILTSRLLNTLTISFDPTYSPTFSDITAATINVTTLDLGTNTITDQNFTGDWNFNNGTVNNINSLTATTANFTTANITLGNITTIDLGTNTITDQNFTGNWNFNGGDLSGVGDILPAADLTYNLGSPILRWKNVFAGTANLTTIDLGVNTITDANMNGNWNFNNGNVTNINSLTATTANITTGNIATIDLGTNTITDGNFTGDWNFNAGNLSSIASATVTGNFNLTASTNLIFGGVTSLGETTSPTDSGAYMVGANDEFANSASTNVQGVLNDLDAAIAGGGPGAMWTLSGGNIYPTNLANNVGIGTSTPGTAKLSVMNGNVGIGTTNPLAQLEVAGLSAEPVMGSPNGVASVKIGSDNLAFGYSTNYNWMQSYGNLPLYINPLANNVIFNRDGSGNVGIGTTNPLSKLSINGGLHVGGDSDAGDNNLLVDGTTTSTGLLTASNGLTLTTGALNLTATSGALTISGLSESSVSAGVANLLFTSGNFNTTATGINNTAIGATTASTGAFTTLSSSGITNLGTAGASAVNIATTGTGATTIGNATGTFQLISSGGLNVSIGGALTGVASLDTITTSSTALTFTGTAPTISVSTAATAINLEAGTTGEINIGSVSSGNVNIAAQGTGNILLAGGSGSTGCTIINASGDLNCSGNITGSSSGTAGFWTRTALNLLPATSGDDLYLPSTSLLGVGYDPTTLSAGTVAAFNGNVGIGTTGPTNLLDIAGGMKIGAGYAGIGTTAPLNGLLVQGNVGIGTTNPSVAKLTVAGDIFPSIDDTYNLGDNTHRWQDLFLGPATLHIGSSTSDEYTIGYNTSTNTLGFNVNGSGDPEITFDSSGNIGLAASSYINFGTTFGSSGYGIRDNAGSLQFKSSTGAWTDIGSGTGSGTSAWSALTAPTSNLGMAMGNYTTAYNWATGTGTNNLFSLTTDNSTNGTGSLLNVQTGTSSTVSPLRVRAGGTEAFFINSSGNVGVGTTAPNEKLTVNGNLSLAESANAPDATSGFGKLYAVTGYGGIDTYTKLLLHADGTGATFTDSETTPKTVTANADVTQSATQSEFGGKSAYFDGTGDYLSLADSEDWNVGSDPVTVDLWIRPTNLGTSQMLFGQTQGSYSPFSVYITTDKKLSFVASSNGSSEDIASSVTGTTILENNIWYHVAFVRNGTSYKVYLNGTQEISVTSALNPFNSTGTFNFGTYAGSMYYTGYMDEIRISKGIARWTSAFTPPTRAYGAGALAYKDSAGNETILGSSSGGGSASLWGQNGSNIYYTSGNVGIGATSPGAKLSLGTSVGDKIRLYDQSSSNYGMGINAGEMQFYITTSAGNHISFNEGGVIQTSGTNEIMRIVSGGNVGIGTTSPTNKFSVYASSSNPNYSSDQASGGTAIGGSDQSGKEKAKAFDNASTTSWVASSGGADWIGYDFGAGVSKTITRYTIQARYDDYLNYSPGSFTLQGSNTGAWGGEQAILDTRTGITWTSATQVQTFTLSNSTAYRYYRIYVTATSGTGQWNVGAGEVEFMETSSYSGGTALEVTNSGNVGIGTTNPSYTLDVGGGTAGMNIRGYDVFTHDGAVTSFSDQRLKSIQGNFDRGLNEILALNPQYYHYKSDNTLGLASSETVIGLMAQDVQKLIPEAVQMSSSGYLTMSQGPIFYAMINAVKQQQTQISGINSQVGDLNLKTSQNVETVQQLQNSVDQNLIVISNNLSSLNSQVSTLNSNVVKNTSDISALQTQIASLEQNTADISRNLTELTANYKLLNEVDTGIISRLDQQDAKIAALAAKMLAGTSGTSASSTASGTFDLSPGLKKFDTALVATLDADGKNIFTLNGTLNAKVLGAESLKLGKQTSGTGTLKAGEIEISIPSTEAKADSKIYITPTGSTEEKILYVGKEDTIDGESFKVKFDGAPAAADVQFNWLIVN